MAAAAEAQNYMDWRLEKLRCQAVWEYKVASRTVEPVGMVYAEAADAQSLVVEEVA